MKYPNNTPILLNINAIDLSKILQKEFIDIILLCSSIDVNVKEKIVNKIQNNKYLNCSFFDGSNLKKEDFLNFLNSINSISLESINIKFFVIYNLDKISNNIQNSMLKFLENIPSNVYCFFSCTDISKILPTILSRLIIKNQLELENNTYSSGNKNWKMYDKNLIDFFKSDIYVQEFLESKNQQRILEFIKNFESNFNEKKMWDIFKNLSYKEIDFVLSILIDENDFELTKTIYDLKEDLHLNLNKTLIFMKIVIARKG